MFPVPTNASATRHAGGCLQPVLLRGRVDHIDGATGELIHRYTTAHEPGGVLPIACKTRRASRCPPCAEVYRADTYQLIRAGLTGGKGIPATVASHPCVFTTLTAPSFGPVHASRDKDGRTLRRGELLNLRWTEIDFDAGKITITGSTAVIGGERVNGTTKSGRTRVVSIDDETVAVLRQRKADQAAEQLRVGDSWRGTKDRYVFTTGWGEPIYPDTVTSLMSKLIRAHNEPEQDPRPKGQVPRARLHDLRHLHATTLLLSGVPVHVVAARLDHADPAVTLRVYAHVIRSAEAAAADIFAQAVNTA